VNNAVKIVCTKYNKTSARVNNFFPKITAKNPGEVTWSDFDPLMHLPRGVDHLPVAGRDRAIQSLFPREPPPPPQTPRTIPPRSPLPEISGNLFEKLSASRQTDRRA